jgi:RES domain-containing protein
VAVPPPPDPFQPLLETWRAGTEIHRFHGVEYGANEFNDSLSSSRFRPIRRASGAVVPTIYGAEGRDSAISETVFHDVPVRGADRRVDVARLRHYVYNVLAPTRDLHLVKFHSDGLRRLGVEPFEIIETEAASYAETIPWGAAAHASVIDGGRPDGIVWMSRQFNAERAVMLFGKRVKRAELELVSAFPVALFSERGREIALEAAERAGITVVFPD